MWVIDNQQYLGEIDSWSRAVQFGDGVFDTLRIDNGKVRALELHVARLEKGLNRLHISLPDANLNSMLGSYAEAMIKHSGMASGILKTIVSRGDSARGYGFDANVSPHVSVFYSPLPTLPGSHQQEGINVQFCATQCAIQSQLAGLKHLNRLENVLAKQELQDACFEGLMANHLGLVIEGTMSNVFFEKDSALYTPNLSLSGVEGVMRQLIINYCRQNNITVHITDINMDAVRQFNRAFICNSVVGILAIKQLNNNTLSTGQLTQQLMAAVNSGEIYD